MLFGCVDVNCPVVKEWLAWAVAEPQCKLVLEVCAAPPVLLYLLFLVAKAG